MRKIAVAPIHSPTHSIGRSDGRCVQRAGTYSVCVSDIHLLGIPGLYGIISKRNSIYRTILRFHGPFWAMLPKLLYSSIVARALPRTSKGITDLLLLPSSSNLCKASPYKKQWFYVKIVPFIMWKSRSLTELTRQIISPTKNGHAPPPIGSRKNYQSVNNIYVWIW